MAGAETTLGRANVAIRATLDQLDGDLSQARGRVDSAVGKMVSGAGQAFQGLGTAALGAIGVATAAVVGLGAALTKITIDAAPVEGLRMAFEGLAESSGQSADELLTALQRGSAGMVAQRDLMQSYNQAAQLVSTTFANQLPQAMGFLGKVSAATGQDMGFMLDSLVKGVGRLSPMILDNLGIQVSLAEATERAATETGLQAEELSKAQIQAGMMAVVMEKLAANTAAMPDVTESAAAKMAQMKARIQDTKDQIGVAFLPVLVEVAGTLGDLADRVLPPVVEWLERMAPIVAGVAEKIGDFVTKILEGEDPITAFKDLLTELLPPEMAEKIIEIVDAVMEFGAQIAEFLAPIIDWISKNVELNDILLALGVAIASVILPALWSIIAAAAPIIAIFVGVIAAIALLRAAWESDFMGIRSALTTFWDNTIKPIFEALVTWLKTNVPIAIQALTNFWQNTLMPAIRTVWGFIQNSLIPLWMAVADLLSAVVGKALEVLAGLWQNVLQPALKKVYDFISDKLKPIFEELVEVFNKHVKPMLEKLSNEILPKLKDAFEGVKKVIGWLVDKIRELADKIRNLELPDWLKPGSPTPFELALRGIADAMRDLSQMYIPSLAYEMQRLETTSAAMAGARAGDYQDARQFNVTIQGMTPEDVLPAVGAMQALWGMT